MMRFFKPKWQHRNPEIRRQAVQALGPADGEILRQVAHEDPAPAVRRLALRRLDDLDLIYRAASGDEDRELREFARLLLLELLAGTREHAPPLAGRLAFLEQHPDAGLLEFVALNGNEAELRRAAQGRVTRQSVLRDVALHDSVLANRQAALERVEDLAMLEAIVRQTRKRDKQIHRRSRERLEALREAIERPARIEAECERICSALESMGQGREWHKEVAQLQRLEQAWQVIEADTQPPQQARYREAHEAFLRVSAPIRQAWEEEQRRWAQALEARQGLLERVRACQVRLQQESEPGVDEAGLAAELAACEAAWKGAGELPSARLQPLTEQFLLTCDAIRQGLGQLRLLRDQEQAMEALVAAAEQLQADRRPVSERALKALEKRWKGQQWLVGSPRIDTGRERFKALEQQLRQRLIKQREQRQGELERLPELLDRLHEALAGQVLKEAVPLYDRIQSSLKHLEALGVVEATLKPYKGRLKGMAPQLHELKSWRSWGADEARERLCEEMEALIGSDTPPKELAGEIRRLRAEWNQLRSEGGAGFKELRKRFDKAASQAYEPCEVHFKQQARERADHLRVKQALLQRLNEFLAAADWSHMEWKEAVRFQRQLSNDWRQAGPVDRRQARELEGRYQQAMATLHEHLELERQRNLEQRQALIEQVQGLAGVEDLNRAIEECKRLQGQWKTSVPGRRQQENALWQAFREACDAVFARRSQQQQEQQRHEQENREQRQQLCERLEGLSQASLAELAEAERQLHQIRDQWNEIGSPGRRDGEALERRFQQAREQFRAHVQALREAERQAQLALLRDKAACCQALERLLESPGEGGDLERQEGCWSELPALQDSATEEAMQARFTRARDALRATASERQRFIDELQGNLGHRQELCLRIEILSGVDSPPEVQPARMEFQANRLAEAIGKGVQDPVGSWPELEWEWYLTGCAPATEERALQARFERAWRAANPRQDTVTEADRA